MKRLLTSCFGLGLLPLCPGTFGSLPPVVLFWLIGHLGLSASRISVIMLIWAAAASVICVAFTPAVINRTGKSDPGEVVIDELAGQCVVFAPVMLMARMNPLAGAAAGFVFFRLFDIAKPFPVNKLEKLPGAWGVLADDLMAGLYAAVVLVFISHFANYLYPTIS